MRKLVLFIVFLSSIPLSYGQGSTASAAPIAINQFGKPVGTALVTICTINPLSGTCSSLVPTYTDNTLSVPCTGTRVSLNNLQFPSTGSGCSNPGYVDNFGNVVPFAAVGFYWCQYSGAGFVPYSQPCIFPAVSTGATPTGLANAGNTITLTAGGILESAVNGGVFGVGDRPVSPDPNNDDDCIFGPYVLGSSSNGIVCTGANGSTFNIDNNVSTGGRDGFQLITGPNNGEIILQATNGSVSNDSEQTSDGWYSSGTIASELIVLDDRCVAVGTAANPSVVNCNPSGGCPSAGTAGCGGGAFSCATNASNSTCVINTNRVCANGSGCTSPLQTLSTILVTQVSDENSALGVTCNTTPVSFMVSSRSDGTSFTITLGTFSVNPVCFNFLIH